MNKVFSASLTLLVLVSTALLSSCTQVDTQQEKEVLTELLDDFLTNVDDPATHDRLWAEDLVYTGSAGTRHGKDMIMDGMRDSEADTSQSSGPSYSYDSLSIKVFGHTAALTFRLIAETPDDTLYYLNSGFFEKRNGQWKAVVWQATRMADSSTD